MRIVIRGLEATPEQRALLETRIRLALSRFDPRRVRLTFDRILDDVDSPSQLPQAHRCRIEIAWKGDRRLKSEESNLHWSDAVFHVLDRSVRVLERQRDIRHGFWLDSGPHSRPATPRSRSSRS